MIIKKPRTLKKIFENIFEGELSDFYYSNPAEVTPFLKDELATFRQMAQTDSSIFAALDTLKKTIMKQSFEISGNLEQVNFIKENFEKININKKIEEMLDALVYGFTVQGIEYELINNKYMVKDLILWGKLGLTADDFAFNLDNDLVLKAFGGNELYENLTKKYPTEIFVNTFSSTDSGGYGLSLLAPLFWIWIFKKQDLKQWASLVKRFGSPALVGLMSDTSRGMKNAAIQASQTIATIESRKGVAINGIRELKVLEGGNAGASNFKDLLDFCNNEIAKVILGSVLMAGDVAQYGTYSRAVQDEKILMSRVKYYTDMLARNISLHLIPKIIKLNFGEQKEYPTIKFDLQEVIDFEKVKYSIDKGFEVDKEEYEKRYLKDLAPQKGKPTLKMATSAPSMFSEDVKKKSLKQELATLD